MCHLTPVIKLQLLSLGDDTALSSSLSVVAKILTRGGGAPSRKGMVGNSAAAIVYEGGRRDHKPKHVGVSRTVDPSLPDAASLML